ncbi:PIN domain-like protein, partial [Mycena rosella]
LEKLFYQLCNFSLAPIVLVFIFDGPGRPAVKRGTKVIYRPAWLIQHLKAMILSFGFHFYDAKAEAELGQLSECGKIDGIITEDSDAFVFGARCVIRTLGPSMQHSSLIYTADTIEDIDGVSLDKDGLFLCALLLGGDYDPGISGAGPTIAHALARQGFGRKLVNILQSFHGPQLDQRLAAWRNSLRQELRTNSSGFLGKHQPKLADAIPDTFLDVQVARLYLHPLTSNSFGYVGHMPDTNSWKPNPIAIFELGNFCSVHFGWNGENLLKKLNSKLWPAVVFRLI